MFCKQKGVSRWKIWPCVCHNQNKPCICMPLIKVCVDAPKIPCNQRAIAIDTWALYCYSSNHLLMSSFLGSIYLNDCNLERMIPIFLIVFGFFSLCQNCIHLGSMCAFRKKEDDTERKHGRSGASCCSTLISLFLFIWILVGSYYVFHNWSNWIDAGKPSCNLDDPATNCCESEVMYTAFTVLIFMYFLWSVFFIACCCLCCGIFLLFVAKHGKHACCCFWRT